jgi:hypothetical protein
VLHCYDRLELTSYESDPVLERLTGISLASVKDVRDILIINPKGNDTLRRWDEVARCTATMRKRVNAA